MVGVYGCLSPAGMFSDMQITYHPLAGFKQLLFKIFCKSASAQPRVQELASFLEVVL